MSLFFILLSLAFTVANWVLALRHNQKPAWAALSALAFTSISLLLEYRIVLNWVNANDWSAMLDVVPTMFGLLTGYVIVIVLANAVAFAFSQNKKPE